MNQFIEQSSDSEQESYGDEDLAVLNLDAWIALRYVGLTYESDFVFVFSPMQCTGKVVREAEEHQFT